MLCHVVIHPLLFKPMQSSKIARLHLTQSNHTQTSPGRESTHGCTPLLLQQMGWVTEEGKGSQVPWVPPTGAVGFGRMGKCRRQILCCRNHFRLFHSHV